MNNRILWRPFADENIHDPYGMYRVLREQDPVHLAQTREYIITRYQDVKEILKSTSFQTGNRLEWLRRGIRYLENKDEDFNAIYEAVNSFILMLNPPQHGRIRNFVVKSWDHRDVEALIRKNVNKVLERISPNSPFDAVIDFAQPVSVFTICDILGIEPGDHRYLKDLGLAMSKAVDLYPSLKELVTMNQAAREFTVFFREQIRMKSEKPGDGLLDRLITKNKTDNIGLEERELVSVAIFLFIAGQETSAGLISNGIYTFAQFPVAQEKFRLDPSVSESAVEEILRFDSTVQLLGRIAAEDYTIAGKTIPKGSPVTLVVGSANRDENFFDRPDEFLVERKPNRHLSFGSGIHFCLGDWLGRKLAHVALRSFFERFKEVSVSGDVDYNKNLAVRTLRSVPVTLLRRSAGMT